MTKLEAVKRAWRRDGARWGQLSLKQFVDLMLRELERGNSSVPFEVWAARLELAAWRGKAA